MEPEGARRLHPFTLLFDVGRRFASLALFALAAVFFAARRQELWIFLFLLPPVIEAVLRYVSFRYAFTPEHLVLREGVLTRTVRHVPYARVQNVDTVQGPLHRLLGVVEVRLETAAGSEPEAVFRVISSAQLDELRARLAGGREPLAAAPAAPVPFFRMGLADVLLFGLLSQRGLLLAGGAWVALREFLDWGNVEERLAPGLEALAQEADGLGFLSWLVLGLAVFVLLQAGSMLWALLTLFDFRIVRHGEELHTTCGLLTRQSASLPRGRVQSLEVRASLLQRLLARVSVRALSAGGDSTKDSQVARKWLAPLLPGAALRPLLAEVQPEADFAGVAWQAVHPRAVRRLFWRGWLVLTLASAPLWLAGPLAGSAAALLAAVLALLGARVRARQLAWGLGESAIFLRDGLLGRRLACVRFEKVQSVRLSRTPLDRRAGQAVVAVDTAGAGDKGLRFRLPYLGLRPAVRLARRLRGAAAAAPFRW